MLFTGLSGPCRGIPARAQSVHAQSSRPTPGQGGSNPSRVPTPRSYRTTIGLTVWLDSRALGADRLMRTVMALMVVASLAFVGQVKHLLDAMLDCGKCTQLPQVGGRHHHYERRTA